MRPVRILALAGLVNLTACVSTQATMLNPGAPKFAQLRPEQVQIFTTQSELDTLDYVRVAIIEATGSGEYTSQTGMMEAIRKKAADLGANGVLMPQIQEPGAGAKIAGAVFGTGTQRKGQAIAVYVRGPRRPPAPEP
jgi:hypothetical protein